MMSTQQALPLDYQELVAHAGERLGHYAPSRGLWLAPRYIAWLGFALMCYAIMGRGFAYLPRPPIFVGELTLAAGLFVCAVTKNTLQVFKLPIVQLLLLFMLWGAIRTIPFVPEYGMDAFRDGVIWAYGFYAITTAAILIALPDQFPKLFWRYRYFAVIFLISVPIILIVRSAMPGLIPHVPNGPSLIVPRRGNIMVHMAAIGGFIIAGFAMRRTTALVAISVPFMMLFGANRAGLVAFGGALGVASVLSKLNKRAMGLWTSLVLVVIIGGTIGVNLSWENKSISIDKLWAKIDSIIGTGGEARMQESKEWRLIWWREIYNYAVVGKYCWTGKGYGINIAVDDGHDVSGKGELRAPHSIHMDILARSGVPGFSLWALLNFVFGWTLFKQFLRTRDRGDRVWAGVFVAILTYWMAHLANAGFDVDIEGPPGGVWFWTMIGVGIAAVQIYKTHPDVFLHDPKWTAPPEQTRLSRTARSLANWARPTRVHELLAGQAAGVVPAEPAGQQGFPVLRPGESLGKR